MEGSRFDALARELATASSRRRLVRGFGAGLAGAVLTGLRLSTAAAAPGGNSVCAHWCHVRFSGAEAGQCTAQAARGSGPCYGCAGPRGEGCAEGEICNLDGSCRTVLLGSGAGSCPADADTCGGSGAVMCGGACQCFQTPEGVSACVDAQSLSCNSRGCMSSADCGPGQACIAPFGAGCGCPYFDWICGPVC